MSEDRSNRPAEATPVVLRRLPKRFEVYLQRLEKKMEDTICDLPPELGSEGCKVMEEYFTNNVGACFTKLRYDRERRFHPWIERSERSKKYLDEAIDCAYTVASAFASAAVATSPDTAMSKMPYDRPRMCYLILRLQIAIKTLRRESEQRADRSSYDVAHARP